MSFATTGAARVRSMKCCVAFDASSGAIVHVHRVITLEGAEETPEREIEETALRYAREVDAQAGELRVLHVDPQSMKAGVHYVVDPAKRALVATERRAARA